MHRLGISRCLKTNAAKFELPGKYSKMFNGFSAASTVMEKKILMKSQVPFGNLNFNKTPTILLNVRVDWRIKKAALPPRVL